MFGNVILKPAATNITAWTRGTSESPSSCKSLNLMPCLRCCRFGRCREVKRLSLPSIQVTSCWFTSLPKDYQGRNPDIGGARTRFCHECSAEGGVWVPDESRRRFYVIVVPSGYLRKKQQQRLGVVLRRRVMHIFEPYQYYTIA